MPRVLTTQLIKLKTYNNKLDCGGNDGFQRQDDHERHEGDEVGDGSAYGSDTRRSEQLR